MKEATLLTKHDAHTRTVTRLVTEAVTGKPKRNPVYCACSDPGCPACKGHCTHKAIDCAHRVDMDDQTGTPVCRACADDMMDSGLFSFKPWNLRLHRAS